MTNSYMRRAFFFFAASLAVMALLAVAWRQTNGQTGALVQIFIQEQPVTPPAPISGVINLVEQDTTLQVLRDEEKVVYLPTYFPSGLTLRQVQKQQPDASSSASSVALSHSQAIILTFAGVPVADNTPPPFFTLRQEIMSGPTEVHIDSRLVITSFNLNGSPAIYYDPGALAGQPSPESMNILAFANDNQMFELRGSVGLNELINVARSLQKMGNQ